MKRRIIRDSSTKEEVEFVEGESGKLWNIEGFSIEFINSVKPPYPHYIPLEKKYTFLDHRYNS